MFATSGIVAALLLVGAEAPAPDRAPLTDQSDVLGSASLAKGEAATAITALERAVDTQPDDPALLINLGIAYAQNGEEAAARAMFERALISSDPVELETADGTATDSRRVARRAIKMLARGEFSQTLSQRD